MPSVVFIVYAVFFLSGAAALMYEVLWVRSLTLVFGGTHLAVTTVLSVFMGGLALGSRLIGKRVDAIRRPLRFYGLLELGIALSAVIFLLLLKIYPAVYTFAVQGRETARLYLTVVRVLFAVLALIIPTTLMGGTLPMLTRYVSGHPGRLGIHLSYLYGLNTLGAVAGTLVTGFLVLRYFSVSTAYSIAILMNVGIGLAGILLPEKAPGAAGGGMLPSQTAPAGDQDNGIPGRTTPDHAPADYTAMHPVLWAIAISGFCALGYEVLWTRILTLTIGTSVYGFAIMLAAFLTGIALGSQAYGLCLGWSPLREATGSFQVRLFGVVQLAIGLSALAVTFYIRDLPVQSITLHDFFLNRGLNVFNARQWANLTLAFAYMLGPAFFMGLAFPLAARINTAHAGRVGHAVGDVLAANTVGAILGSALSGFFMIYVFGIERSLQLLTVVNMGLGLLLVVSVGGRRLLNWGTAALTAAALSVLVFNPDLFRIWDTAYFAIFQNNQPDAFNTPERKRDAIENTDVLFYHEGVNSTISVIKVKGGNQAVLVNGKVVASSSLKDRQCQLTLGHLPMLMHANPRKVLVVGLGTGMTLGAVSVHPGLEALTLVEIEPNVLGAARTFGRYNHEVLDDPKLEIVFNDGRNFLMTTSAGYDVITADPIHPWTQGAGYLYTAEYFQTAARHLLPGGVVCQWLPIYELNVEDLKSVVKTFSQSFKYTMTWLTQYDAELIGSNTPLRIDEALLAERLGQADIAADLRPVMMGSAADFLSFFIMGTKGMAAFSRNGVVNTDDNLYLEFSTPASVGKNVMQANIEALARHRESILAYLSPAPEPAAREQQKIRWTTAGQAAALTDQAHALFLGGRDNSRRFQQIINRLGDEYHWFAPARFLIQEYRDVVAMVPRLIRQKTFELLDDQGRVIRWTISAVMARAGGERAAAVFVDNAARQIYGQRYFSGPDLDQAISGFIDEVMQAIQTTYLGESRTALGQGRRFPSASKTLLKIKQTITDMTGPSGAKATVSNG